MASSYKKFHILSQKTKIHLRIVKRKGLPFYRIRYRKRIGALLGILLLIASIALSGQFVWKIEVHGNKRVPTNQIIDAVNEHGVHLGSYKRRIDVIAVGERLSVEFDEISWAAVNLIGTVAHIEIIERVMPPDMLSKHEPCNIIANRAGQIEAIEVYEGEKMVNVGDTVQAGDMIASGILEDKKGRTHLKHARAKLVLSFSEEKDVCIPMQRTEYITEGEHKNYYRLKLGGMMIPLGPGKRPQGEMLLENNASGHLYDIVRNNSRTWARWEKTKDVTLFGIALPMSVSVEQYTPVSLKAFELSAAEAKRRALEQLNIIERCMKSDGITIHHRSLRGGVEGDSYILHAVYQCSQEAAREEAIMTQLQGF